MIEALDAILMMGGLGLFVGIGLAMASKIFYVYVDPLIAQVDEALPGANCGGCGLPGCSANAEAIVAGRATPNSCVAAGPEVAEIIAEIMGVAVEAREPDIARPGCSYGTHDADIKYIYDGLKDCRAAALINGGMKVCSIGCLGLGTCADACPFDAITMGPDGLPNVDELKCTGCGTCERVCPKNIITLSSVTRRIIREYTLVDCTTPCQRACPAGIDICAYIQQIHLKNYNKALQIIKERNPFPSVIGRICPRPCEEACRRQYVDEPVAINFLKRFVADYERENGEKVFPYRAPDTGRKIAVAGGGVEGLSTAFFLSRLGHTPTVFEAAPRLGGLLRTAIAANRLPQDILDWDISGILEMGVAAHTESVLGKDITINSLLSDGYDAVFVSLGGWDSRLSRGAVTHPETPIPAMQLLMDFLRDSNTGSAFGDQKTTNIKDTVFLGGGKLSIETAVQCKESGSGNITVIFRKSSKELRLSEETLTLAKSKGIRLLFSTGITRLFGEDDSLTDIEYIDLHTRQKQTIKTDRLLVASGRFPELIFSRPKPEIEENDFSQVNETNLWQAIYPSKHPEYNHEVGLLAKGDILSDYSAAIKAIGAGRRAAASIHNVMYGIPLSPPENVVTSTAIIQNVQQVDNVTETVRSIMPLSDHRTDHTNVELEKGFTAEMAETESSRCLRCGLICYEKH